MARVVVLGGYNVSLINFRGKLIEQLVKEGHEVTACAPGNDPQITERLEAIGAKFRSINLHRAGMNPVADLRSMLDLRQTFQELKPDVAFLYTIKPVIYGSMAAKSAGVPRIYSMITGLGTAFAGGNWKQQILCTAAKQLYKLALSFNAGVFFQNPDDAGLFLSNRLVNQDKVTITAGSGVDLDHYEVAPLPEGPPRFLMCCRILKQKGVREYLEAAAMVKQKYPDAIFEHVGPFDTENPDVVSKEEIAEWNREARVKFLGGTDDVRPFLRNTSVYVLPSYSEGTPRTVLEAAAMGRPAITTDGSGCRQTVRHEETGYLVPIRNSKALAKAMMQFLEQPATIAKMGEAGRHYMEERFDVHKVNQVILETMGLTKSI